MFYSIAIPAYKDKYLKDCINSILHQNYSNFELIIVNDASPYNLDDIVEKFSDKRIRYYKNKKNIGAENVVDNWNKCLSYAKGDYFILMGDDDLLNPNYLEEFNKLIFKYPQCNIYHCRSIIINQFSQPLRLTETRPEHESVYDSILQRIKGNRVFFISDYVYKTSILRKNNGFYKLPLAWASDDISSYIASIDFGIAHTNKILFQYRRNPSNISSTGNFFLKMEAILSEKKWLINFTNSEPNDYWQKIVNSDIKNNINKHIHKKRRKLIAQSLYNKGFLQIFQWIKYSNRLSLHLSDFLYAILYTFSLKMKQ